ncbi:MAG TPA: hypothetical protein VFB37_04590, partial [Steroidobacteraceae bacterium]|nr:hypothetical protein [Steroidobacteraceae bacterium]
RVAAVRVLVVTGRRDGTSAHGKMQENPMFSSTCVANPQRQLRYAIPAAFLHGAMRHSNADLRQSGR